MAGYSYDRRSVTASTDMWLQAVESLQKFSKACDLVRQGDEKVIRRLPFLPNDFAITLPENSFMVWAERAFRLKDLDYNRLETMRQAVKDVAMVVQEAPVVTESPLYKDLVDVVESYEEEIQKLVQKVAPEQFTYQGFEITNEDRLSESVVRELLAGIDYLVGLFKRRGMEKLLKAGVTSVNLLYQSYMGGKDAAGQYFPSSRSIYMYAKNIKQTSVARFIEEWAAEVFLHEFGHFIHMFFLPKEAEKVWDEGWSEVNSLKTVFNKITPEDRDIFWNALSITKFNPSKAAARLTDFQKVKFGVWLRTSANGPLITPAQFRLSDYGKQFFEFFVDPEEFIKKDYSITKEVDGLEAYNKKYLDVLGRKMRQLFIGNGKDIPISSAVVAELAKSDPGYAKAIANALDKLDIVSDYGKTDEKEDFAESFVAFVAAPEKLTPTAKYRMQRALSIAGLYGKEVMKLSKDHTGFAPSPK